MPSKVNAANAVVSAIEEVCAIYGVRCYRMQSRTFTVPGAGGRDRPFFVGEWRDRNGTKRRKGMADLLLTPKIHTSEDGSGFEVAVVLWVECKSGTGILRAEQEAFRDDVTEAGAYYIEAHDSADAVVAWFEAQGVTR